MQINIIPNGQETCIRLSGELDTVAANNQTEDLNKIITLADNALEIDCSELKYISSAGLRFFMQLKRASETKGGTIRITHLNEDVADIFRISGFKNIFHIE